MGSIVKYSGFSDEDFELAEQATESSGKFFKLTKDKTQVRFCPAKTGNKPVVVTYNHFVELIPGEKDSKINVNCPRKMARRHCPICVKAESLMNTGSKKDRDRGFELLPKLRVYSTVIDRANEDTGAQVYAFGKMVWEQLRVIREDNGDFCNPGPEGFDIILRKKGTGLTTKYTVTKSDHNAPMLDDAPVMDDTINMLPDLSQYARVPSDAEMKAAMDTALGKDGDDDAEERPARKPARSEPRSSSRSIDDSIDTTGESLDGFDDEFE